MQTKGSNKWVYRGQWPPQPNIQSLQIIVFRCGVSNIFYCFFALTHNFLFVVPCQHELFWSCLRPQPSLFVCACASRGLILKKKNSLRQDRPILQDFCEIYVIRARAPGRLHARRPGKGAMLSNNDCAFF